MKTSRLMLGCLSLLVATGSPALAKEKVGAGHAEATTPALAPGEAVKRFAVPRGFEVRLFASEPELINPVAMTWDERGRLWVIELFQYPRKAPAGTKGLDRIKILEDTNNDGRADKATIFADGLDMATGLAVGRGGVFVGQAPDLLFLEDTNHDDIADRRTVLLTGFDTHDKHETLNGFTWGPDGWLYMTHGVFNKSRVRRPEQPEEEGNPFNAVVARYRPEGRTFEIFADGTSNPWGVDFDRNGNAFVSACVIDHLFHMAPGGVYVRQAGTPGFPYGYQLLSTIADHKHFRAAYAGVQIYQGDQYPEAYRGSIVMGNIHGNAVNRDRLIPAGSTFKASAESDFVTSTDGWFRPVSEQVGPDGNIWIADWYDKFPCYQNAMADPDGVDRQRGRIWRVVYTGNQPGAPRPSVRPGLGNLATLPSARLVTTLADANVWQRRVAQRVLSERRDPSVKPALVAMATATDSQVTLEGRLAALWTLHGAGLLDEATLDAAARDREPGPRAWAARLTGERQHVGIASPDAATRGPGRLERLAHDPDPTVRAGVAAAARDVTGDHTQALLTTLAEQGGTADDRLLAFLIWRALEPLVAKDPQSLFAWIRDGKSTSSPFAAELLHKTVRRLYDTGDPARLADAVTFLGTIANREAALVAAGVDGLLKGYLGGGRKPDRAAIAVLRRLAARREPEVATAARRLAVMAGDPAMARQVLASVRSAAVEADQLWAIQTAGDLGTGAARKALVSVLGDKGHPQIVAAALEALGKIAGDEGAKAIVKAWKQLPPEARPTAIRQLAERPAWTEVLLTAVERKTIAAADVPFTVRSNLNRNIKDPALAKRVTAVLGHFRESNFDVAKAVADKKRVVLNGPVDFADGHAQAQKTCLLCHKLNGEGADVGPDLTGVGRSSLDALLTNVIDPNQVIGKGYEQVTVTTKDGRSIGGRVIDDTPARLTLVGANLKEIIPRAQIASVVTGDVSLMPEGLDQLPDAAFRNLIWYIYAPPADPSAQIRLEIRDKKLAVLARAPGAGRGDQRWIDLMEYVMDPAVRPYIHPLRAPTGDVVLTDDRPSDHVWQHGVFTGLHKVDGVDFWTERQGKQRFVRLLEAAQANDRVSWRALAEWVAPGGNVVLEEEQAITVYAPATAESYAIDFEWSLKPVEHEVTFGRHEYGGLSVRMPADPSHTHLNASGLRGRETSEKRTPWCTVERAFAGAGVWGIALMDHPGNDRHPAAWRVDGQGMISPSPSLQGDWSIPFRKKQTMRYRLVVYKGPGEVGRLQREFERFAASPVASR